MEENRVTNIELQIALMQQDINALKSSATMSPPSWIKKSALALFGIVLLQIASTIWWASEITTKQSQITEDVKVNTQFRQDSPAFQQEIMIQLTAIQTENEYMKEMMQDVKEKLRFINNNPQQPNIRAEE